MVNCDLLLVQEQGPDPVLLTPTHAGDGKSLMPSGAARTGMGQRRDREGAGDFSRRVAWAARVRIWIFDRAAAGPADSAWTVSQVIFTGSPVTFVTVGVCE